MSCIQHNRKFISLLLALFSVFFGCTKEEVIIETDSRPLEIKTVAVGNLTATEVTLYGEIVHLNDETVIDHGFLLTSGSVDNTITLSVKEAAKPGTVSYLYKPTEPFKANGYYTYSYYVQTDKNLYVGTTSGFMVNDIRLFNQDEIAAAPGEQVNLKGSFKQLDESFRLLLDYPINKEVPFTVSEDGTTLSFTMPTNISGGYNPSTIYLRNNENMSIRLLTIQILGVLYPPAAGLHYFSDPIVLRGDGLPSYYFSSPFKVIIGNRVLDYSDRYLPNELSLSGDAYRIGYYNGKDTVIFDEPWQLVHPDASAIGFSSPVVHPGAVINIIGIDFYKFFENQAIQTVIGQVDVFSAAMYNSFERQIYVPNLPNGHYPVSLKSKIYPTLSSKETLEIQALKISSIDVGDGYYGSPVVVKGNFLPNQEYVIRCCDDLDFFFGEAKDGELQFELPTHVPRGSRKLKIGYRWSSGEMLVADESKSVQINGVTIDSFFPSSGHPGDIITVRGRGLKNNAYGFSIGGESATIISMADGEYQIMVPLTLRKGPSKITLGTAGGFEQSTAYFTIL